MVTVNRLTKQYGSRRAVSDLNFSLETGKIYGLLGPNGAGKSTTLNMITGCLAPTEGTVTIDGLDIYQNAKAAKAKLGYLPEIPPLYPEMTVREYLLFVAEAKK
ncbi:MAG: ATP-binding cassette domain-containing protein, partial [Oscillospiraceae bacterium]|nr:ATP-binding cassette domain-containing protein [Oscillospiraceae bacterium]